MKNKIGLIVLIVVLAVVIIGGVLLYDALKDEVEQPDPFETPTPTPTEGQSAQTTPPPDEGIDERVKAPDFTVQDINGNYVKLSDMLGKPVVINFWASWCPPCKGEMPDFNKVFEEVGDAVQFMMVNAVGNGGETKQSATDYIAKEGFTFPIFFDVNQEALSTYEIWAFPTSIFIDAEGYIVAGVEGAMDEATLRRGIGLIWGIDD